jgi:hypothetical protein
VFMEREKERVRENETERKNFFLIKNGHIFLGHSAAPAIACNIRQRKWQIHCQPP